MSEHQAVIDALTALYTADEGDRINSTDLGWCETAVAVIQDLEAEKASFVEATRSLLSHIVVRGDDPEDFIAAVERVERLVEDSVDE